jgi:hypothetical protein
LSFLKYVKKTSFCVGALFDVYEKIKLMGFDGLRFRSSLKAGGVNVVLFEDKKCKAIHSDIIKVGAINVSIEKPDIYLLEEYLN